MKIGGSKKKLPTKLIGLVAGVAMVMGIGLASYNLVWVKAFEEEQTTTTQTTDVKSTSYKGEGVNETDAAATEAYCEDTKERINITGSSRIIDTCVAKSVSNEWLSKMTSSEIEQMYIEQPSCIETGYDDEGFNCFTGYSREGCNRGGQRDDGTYCEGAAPKDPVDLLSGFSSQEMCGLVADCQAESEFNPDGFNKFDCDRQGRDRSGKMCAYEHITRIYDDADGKDQLGFLGSGFNEYGCDIRGYDENGDLCPIENVTRVYGLNKKDQYGFFEDSYNDNGCDINGLNRESEACDLEDITRIFDPSTGLDQLGFGKDGYNIYDCHFSWFNRKNEICDESKVTRIVGKSGKDQRGIFASAVNEFGCLATGVKRNGQICTHEEMPKVYSPVTGKNALGFFKSGVNESGCSTSGYNLANELCDLDDVPRNFDKKTLLDQFGLTSDNLNSFGCGIDGYSKSGEICEFNEIPLIVNPKTGLNQFGLTEDGFSPETGCSITGFNKQGERCDVKDIPRIFKNGSKYDQFNLDASGYNPAGCSLEGLTRSGEVCALEDIPRIFDPETGLDQFNISKSGFAKSGCNLQGERADGTQCSLEETPRIFGRDNFDQNGVYIDGSKKQSNAAKARVTNTQGKLNSSKLDTANLSQKALEKLGFVDGIYNENQCDVNGISKSGEICSLNDITRIFDKNTGLDQFSLDPEGYNIYDCNLAGKRRDGTLCPSSQITRLYDKNNKDQFGVSAEENPVIGAIHRARKLSSSLSPAAKAALGLDEDGYSKDTKCNLAGLRRDGTLCDFEDIPKIYDPETGLDQFAMSKSGYNQFSCDFNGKKIDGSQCKPEEITEFVNAFGFNQFDKPVSGSPKNNPLYSSREDGEYVEHVKALAESKAKMGSANIANPDALKSLTKKKALELGLDAEYFNDKGCGIDGLDRQNNVCDIDDIPRIFDPETGLDQFGFTKENYNSFGCDFYGFKKTGERCEESEITTLSGANGQTQFTSPMVNSDKIALSKVQQDALAKMKSKTGFINSEALEALTPALIAELGLDENLRNSAGCGLDGKREDGSLCPIEDIPRVYDPVTGIDQFGINRSGVNSYNCGLDGKRLDGSICPPNEVTRIVGDDNKDQFGKELTDKEKLRKIISGLSGNVSDVSLLAELTDEQIKDLDLDENFRNAKGCGLDALREDGSLCSLEETPRFFDPDTGLDQFGLTRGNRNIHGCDLAGLDENNVPCEDSKVTRFLSAGDIDTDGRRLATEESVEAYLNNKPENIKNPSALEFLTNEKIKELGLDENLRNAKGCGLDGLRADGTICSLEDTPRVFDPETGLDQFGLGKDNRNIWGCDLSGMDRNNARCSVDKTTRIFGHDNFDQNGYDHSNLDSAGLTPEKRNIYGCDISGRKPSGQECEEWEKIDTYGIDGFNNQHKTRAGEDRFKLIDGRNAFGCDINGLREDGSLCPIEEISRFFKDDGTDQFGLRRNNRNAFGCDLDGKREDGTVCPLEEIPRIFNSEGVDQLSLTVDGFAENGCSIFGLREDGSICPLNEIPRIIGDDGFDQFKVGLDGFNDKNCNLQGLNRQNELCELEDIPMIFGADGLSQLKITRDGFAANNCSVKGVNRQGERCATEDIPRLYDGEGKDQFGIFADGYTSSGCSLSGVNRQNELCEQSDVPRIVVDGVDQLNFGDDSFNPETGCNLDNKDKFGNACHPKFAVKIIGSDNKDQFGLINDVNQYGCTLSGLKKDGTLCEVEEITQVVDPETGLSQIGIDPETGLNTAGCGFDGRRADGSLCDIEDIPRLVDDEGVDQFDLNEGGFSIETGCSLLGVDKEGNDCAPEDVPFILGADGLTHLGVTSTGKTEDGYNYLGFDDFSCDRNNMKADGTHCNKYVDHNIDVADTEHLEKLKALQLASLAKYQGLTTNDIGEGTISASEIEFSKVRDTSSQVTANRAAVIPVSQNQVDANKSANGNGIVEIPEGTTMHVYVDTPVNTDYTTTVWGTIVGGEYDGSLVRGTIVVPYIDDVVMPRDKFKYEFNTMIRNRKSYAIQAVSMTFEDLGEFVEADSVNYHRIQRFGGLLTAAAFQSLGASYLDSEEEQAIEAQSEYTESATSALLGSNVRANTKENLKIATDEFADIAKQNFYRRPTIKKGATDLMIIFMQPIDNDELPAVYMDIR